MIETNVIIRDPILPCIHIFIDYDQYILYYVNTLLPTNNHRQNTKRMTQIQDGTKHQHQQREIRN